jgi:LysM repeat protein
MKQFTLLTWPDYIAPKTISDFENEFGAKVNLEIVPSAVELVERMMTGSSSVDVLCPPHYAVRELGAANRLAVLDHTKLTNEIHLDRRFKAGRPHDPRGQVSIPKDWGTTVEAIRAANPGLGWWVYAGQVLYVPGGSSYTYSYFYSYSSYGGNYTVQWGDTLAKIARAHGVSVNDLLSANPNIWSASVIYAGQVIYIPSAPVYQPASYHTVSSGDTLRKIASWYGTTVYNLQLLNPQIYDINYIYPGQVIRVR